MKKITVFVIILLFFLIIINYELMLIYLLDIEYILNRYLTYNYVYNTNKILDFDKKDHKSIRLLLLTFDNRKNLDYLIEHNKNINQYCSFHPNVEYEFVSECNTNVYWCKIYLMLERLKTNKYDYVMWLDSDTIIPDLTKSLQKLFSEYSSSIFISHDNFFPPNNALCAGIFVVSNTKIGINFLTDCIDHFEKSNCVNSKGKLKGLYAQSCYEQGVINKFINEKYLTDTTILPPSIFRNENNCEDYSDVFVIHAYGSGYNNVSECFKKINEQNKLLVR